VGTVVIYSAETRAGSWSSARDLWWFDMVRYGTTIALHRPTPGIEGKSI